MRCVLITGASGGIGGGIARRLAEDGFAVAAASHRNAEEAERLCAELREKGHDAAAFSADLRDPREAERLVSAVSARFGHVDALVSAAGVAKRRLFTEMTAEEFREVTDANLTAAFFSAQAAARGMIVRHAGNIVFISSVWGIRGASMEAAYSAAKAGIIGLSQALAAELAPSGIRVNCVCPGVIDTKMNASLSEEELCALAEETPLSRLGTPADVAEAVSYLLSDRASFVTGQNLCVDGGFLL